VVDQEAVTRALPLVPGTRMTLPLMLHSPQVAPTCTAASGRLVKLKQTVLCLLRIPINAYMLSPHLPAAADSHAPCTFTVMLMVGIGSSSCRRVFLCSTSA